MQQVQIAEEILKSELLCNHNQRCLYDEQKRINQLIIDQTKIPKPEPLINEALIIQTTIQPMENSIVQKIEEEAINEIEEEIIEDMEEEIMEKVVNRQDLRDDIIKNENEILGIKILEKGLKDKEKQLKKKVREEIKQIAKEEAIIEDTIESNLVVEWKVNYNCLYAAIHASLSYFHQIFKNKLDYDDVNCDTYGNDNYFDTMLKILSKNKICEENKIIIVTGNEKQLEIDFSDIPLIKLNPLEHTFTTINNEKIKAIKGNILFVYVPGESFGDLINIPVKLNDYDSNIPFQNFILRSIMIKTNDGKRAGFYNRNKTDVDFTCCLFGSGVIDAGESCDIDLDQFDIGSGMLLFYKVHMNK